MDNTENSKSLTSRESGIEDCIQKQFNTYGKRPATLAKKIELWMADTFKDKRVSHHVALVHCIRAVKDLNSGVIYENDIDSNNFALIISINKKEYCLDVMYKYAEDFDSLVEWLRVEQRKKQGQGKQK